MKKALFVTSIAALLFATSCRKTTIIQPILFNHKIHVVENEIDCIVCHTMYKTQHTSGRPVVKICAMCHIEMLGDTPEEKKLVEKYIEPEKEIPWLRIFRTRRDVYYSHRRHVVLGSLKCKQCHGDIKNATKPPTKPVVMSMEDCIGCHRENSVTEDCVACHR